MKLFKWFIELKIKDLTSEEKSLYLANKLIDELQKSGKNLVSQTNFISIWVTAYRVYSSKAEIEIKTNDSEINKGIRGALTTKINKQEEI
jgi:hypothetical protein